MFLIVYVLAFVLLVCCWIWGDLEFRPKLIVTAVYLGSWLLLFISPYAVIAVQALFCVVVGYMTFGSDWGRG
ncbi:MAG TPA: hypothetical protein VGZ47_04575 [Gemmataceae bacterium]|jgi:hypothetical protein|nr:hypothetical protein [Gemmataceae bacterium]